LCDRQARIPYPEQKPVVNIANRTKIGIMRVVPCSPRRRSHPYVVTTSRFMLLKLLSLAVIFVQQRATEIISTRFRDSKRKSLKK
jgi:hypothetical protein